MALNIGNTNIHILAYILVVACWHDKNPLYIDKTTQIHHKLFGHNKITVHQDF